MRSLVTTRYAVPAAGNIAFLAPWTCHGYWSSSSALVLARGWGIDGAWIRPGALPDQIRRPVVATEHDGIEWSAGAPTAQHRPPSKWPSRTDSRRSFAKGNITKALSQFVQSVTEDSDSSTTRRRLLRTASVVGMAAIAGCGQNTSTSSETTTRSKTTTVTKRSETGTQSTTGTDTETTTATTEEADSKTPYDDRFSNVVDVAAAGADTTGSEPINHILESKLADDTLFYFPRGTYRISGMLVIQHYDNVGFYGDGAVLRPSQGQWGNWLIVDDVSRFLLERLTLSNEAPQTGVRTKIHVTGGENVVRDVDVVGFHDVGSRTHAFTLQVNGAKTVLNMVRVSLTDGAANGTGVFVHPAKNPGTLRFKNCEIAQWHEQGLYGSPHGGPMFVLGGRYANNGMAQVRVGGGNSDTPAVIRDVTVEVDDPYPADRKGNVRGIWLNEGANTLVENCDVSVTALSRYGSSGAVVVAPEHGSATIRNTDITVEDQTFALALTKPKDEGFVIPSLDHPPENWSVDVESVSIAGGASDGLAVWVVDRPECTFRDVTIDQPGRNRDGIGILRSSGVNLVGLSCVTGGYPVATSFGYDEKGCDLSMKQVRSLESRSVQMESASPVVEKRGQQYCLRRQAFDVTEDKPVVALTNLNDTGIHTTLLSESRLQPD